MENGKEKIIARKNTTCGYCDGMIGSADKFCRHCGATLIDDLSFDKMDSYAKEYAAAR